MGRVASPGYLQGNIRPDRARNNQMNWQPTRGRLAPSPTGGLHVGHARTFLIAWLLAKADGGTVVLRIEDLDATRVRAEAAVAMLDDLAWFGLHWDEGPYVQSERIPLIMSALDVLKAKGLVYPCVCSRADIARAASAPHASEEGPTYPGTCSGKSVSDADGLKNTAFAWRFRVPRGDIEWDDLVLGPQAIDPSIVGGDFIVGRNLHGPAYQLAVAHDDAAMAINQVIRGDDLLPSTPRQILLYRALGWKPPRFGHAPLVVDPSGKRLAKRDGSIKLASLREAGVAPNRLIGHLARSLGIALESDQAMPVDLISAFDLRKLPRDAWVFDVERFMP